LFSDRNCISFWYNCLLLHLYADYVYFLRTRIFKLINFLPVFLMRDGYFDGLIL
jgi:hypothetical protein